MVGSSVQVAGNKLIEFPPTARLSRCLFLVLSTPNLWTSVSTFARAEIV